jgi:hypothetical protein
MLTFLRTILFNVVEDVITNNTQDDLEEVVMADTDSSEEALALEVFEEDYRQSVFVYDESTECYHHGCTCSRSHA